MPLLCLGLPCCRCDNVPRADRDRRECGCPGIPVTAETGPSDAVPTELFTCTQLGMLEGLPEEGCWTSRERRWETRAHANKKGLSPCRAREVAALIRRPDGVFPGTEWGPLERVGEVVDREP